jgi:Cu(I)/Ag(I) efflux system membrane fusion protein
MKRAVMAVAILAAISAAGVGGFMAAQPKLWRHAPDAVGITAAAQTSATPVYYQDPDGKPFYSLKPKQTVDGRNYRPVAASADIRFDDDEASSVVASSPASSSVSDRKIKYYRNPMGLPDTSTVPKKDSMGMDYIPVYDGEDSDDGTIKLSPGKLQRAGVRAEPVAARVIRTAIRGSGTIQLDERRVAVITMRSEGWVEKVENVTTGSKVTRGQPLMTFYSPDIAAAAANFVASLGSSKDSGASNGARQRLMNLNVPEAVIARMETTRKVPLSVPWTAPRDAIVIERNVVEGMRAQPGDVLFRLADATVVWAMVDIAERDLAALAIGQPVSVRARSFVGRVFSGKVGVIYPQINKDTRTVRVRIELANPDIALLPDMYVDADIDTGRAKPVLSVPESAVIDTGSRQVAFVDRGEGRLEPRDVKPGARGDGYVEIREGLTEGEAVVVSANFLIDAESNLRAALNGFSEAGGVK